MDATATYSPEDNKLRLYPAGRLDAETYARAKALGFAWAPKQELFVAPAWTPDREDFLVELAGEIGDEDTSLVDRAEERAERFGGFGESRAADAERAYESVSAVAERFAGGQPILVGHHSEKKARKDKERIEAGMRRAVKCWETSRYWTDRAAGAIRHAKYKERPDVRARRIKTIEADRRKQEREREGLTRRLEFWSRPEITLRDALAFTNAGHEGGVRLPNGEQHWSAWSALERGEITVEAVREQRLSGIPAAIARVDRWLAHFDNRLAYERAMLAEAGGMIADRFDFKVGGQVLAQGLWLTILKVNKSGGAVSSVSTNNTRWPRVVPVETIRDYRAPEAEAAERVKAATKLPPLCNYPATAPVRDYRTNDPPKAIEARAITKAEWDRCPSDYKTTRVVEGTEAFGRHRVRMMQRGGCLLPVYLSDEKRKDPPPPEAPAAVPAAIPPVEHDLPSLERAAARSAAFRAECAAEEAHPIARLKDTLEAGVRVVTAPQLFPTPASLALRVSELARIDAGMTVLEPSAGTGNLVRECLKWCAYVTAVEINPTLASGLRGLGDEEILTVRCADFLECDGDLGTFDRIVMNPPFANGQDIEHVRHALGMLRSPGRLVAIVANGPRQRERLMPEAAEWHDLPADAFRESGTSVNAAIAVFER